MIYLQEKNDEAGRTVNAGRLPSDVPWSPGWGFLCLAMFLLLSFLGAGIWFFLNSMAGFYLQVFFSHGGTLLLIFCFLLLRTGTFAGVKDCLALHLISPGNLIKKAFFPAVTAAAVLFAWFFLNSMLRELVGYSVVEQPQIRWLRDRGQAGIGYHFYALIAIVVFLGPVTEELLFRSILYFPVRKVFGIVKACIIVSLLFAVFHIYPAESRLDFLMNAFMITGHLFILSVFFTFLLERTGSILAPIAGHVIYNALVVLLVFYGPV